MDRTSEPRYRPRMVPPRLTQRDNGVQSMAEILADLLPCFSISEEGGLQLARESTPVDQHYALSAS